VDVSLKKIDAEEIGDSLLVERQQPRPLGRAAVPLDKASQNR
jgi:hypothetical protein